ncbi:MAG: ABC transporter substrate-binding protein [Hyphomicrobiaceae bacterium]
MSVRRFAGETQRWSAALSRVCFCLSLCVLVFAGLATSLPAAAAGKTGYTIAYLISSDFDGCYVPGVIRAIRQFAEAEAEEINARGGIAGQPISLIFLDDEDKAEKTVANVKTALAEPGLLAMIGVPSSTRGKAVFDALGKEIDAAGVPFITEISLNRMFYQHSNVFTLASAVDNELEVIKAFLAANHFDRPAFVGLEGDLYTGAIGDGLKELAAGRGLVADHRIKVVNYKLDESVAAPVVADLITKQPDVIFLGLGSGAGATFLKELDRAGSRAPIFIVLGRITRLLGRAGALAVGRPMYQLGWDGVPNAYNERLRQRIWQARDRNWVFDDVPAKLTSAEYQARNCRTREPQHLTVLADKNRRAIGRGAQYRDMLALLAQAGATAPKGAPLGAVKQHLVREVSSYTQRRRVLRGWWQDWSFTKARASAADTLIITKPTLDAPVVLASTQFARVGGELEPRPVVYISLDLISLARIDTNDKSFDAEFYLSFKSAAPDIDINSIEFTNAYRAQTGKDKLLRSHLIHAGSEETSFPKNVKVYRVSGKFTFEPELARYPFDTQRLSISFQPSSAARPFLIQPPVGASHSGQFASDGWKPGEAYVGSDQDIIPTIDSDATGRRIVPFYKFNYTWVVKRSANDYYLRVVVPLGFILLVTYFSVFLSHTRFESLMGIQVTALLSAIALYLALPKVDSDQATLSDKIFMITYALVSLMIGLAVFKDLRWVHSHARLRKSVSFVQIFVFPAVAIGVIGYLLYDGPVNEVIDALMSHVRTITG